MINKKAVSPIVATILILAITVAAAVVLYSVVTPLLKGPKSVLECQQVTFKLDDETSCIKIPGAGANVNEVSVSIDRTASKSTEPSVVEWAVVLGSVEGAERITKKCPSPAGSTLCAPSIARDWDITATVQKTPKIGITSADKTQLGEKDVGVIEVYPVIKLRIAKEDCTENRQSVRLRVCA